eukprot:scaffold16068_cov113-Isochrysis_galbana.AAC.3
MRWSLLTTSPNATPSPRTPGTRLWSTLSNHARSSLLISRSRKTRKFSCAHSLHKSAGSSTVFGSAERTPWTSAARSRKLKSVVKLDRRVDHRTAHCPEGLREVCVYKRLENQVEDGLHRRVLELGEGDEVEVAQKAIGDNLAPAARRSHGADIGDVDDLAELPRLALIPATIPKPLAQNLNRRLRAVFLSLRHVDIIDKYNVFFARRWPVDPLAPLVDLGVDLILCHIGGRLRREADKDWAVIVGHPSHELVHHVQRLAGAGRPDREDVPLVTDKLLEHPHVADRVEIGNCLHPPDPLSVVEHDRHVVNKYFLRQTDDVVDLQLGEALAKVQVELGARGRVGGRARAPDDGEDDELLEQLRERCRELFRHLVPAFDRDEVRPESRQNVEGRRDQVIVDRRHVLLRALANEGEHTRQELFQPLAELRAVRLDGGIKREEPAVDLRAGANHLLGFHKNGADARYGGGRGNREVLHLKHHRHKRRHGDYLARREAYFLVVIEHGVHRLDPQGVDWAIKDDPLLVGRVMLRRFVDSRTLAHGYRLGIKDVLFGRLVARVAKLRIVGRVETALCLQQHVLGQGLAATSWTNGHEAVTQHRDLVYLDAFGKKEVRGDDAGLAALVTNDVEQIGVVGRGHHKAGEQVAEDGIEENHVLGEELGPI